MSPQTSNLVIDFWLTPTQLRRRLLTFHQTTSPIQYIDNSIFLNFLFQRFFVCFFFFTNLEGSLRILLNLFYNSRTFKRFPTRFDSKIFPLRIFLCQGCVIAYEEFTQMHHIAIGKFKVVVQIMWQRRKNQHGS